MAHSDDIGARVRAARSYADLSQQGLADAIGVERRIIGYIEGNETRHVLTVPEAQRIAKACGVPFSFLVDGWTLDLAERVAGLDGRLGELERLVHAQQQETRSMFTNLTAREHVMLEQLEETLRTLPHPTGREHVQAADGQGSSGPARQFGS